MVSVPYLLGLLTWPAFLYAITVNEASKITSGQIWWVRISLIVDILLSILGVYLGYMLPFLSPLALMTLIVCVWLLHNFEQQHTHQGRRDGSK
ncbi:MAG: hypothetical protein JNN05_04330 [Candidatus Omnitrophica bacterium]|nr:hypothetical protein [Candidatus Omnitrophota bacterium]